MAINWLATRHAQAVRTPRGIEIAVGAAGLVVAALVAAGIPAAYPQWRMVVMAAAVALFAAISLDPVGLAMIAILAFAITNGFLEDQFGQLTWHGSADVWRLALLVIACGWGLAVGSAARQVIRMRGTTPSIKEEEHGA